ncbi:MAG: class I SAM-dependent methyltransferase [Geminicoccaceae bacterium]|nr:MAG: class I SAM-dependent methyltransferase [Geminicoccaceae bacterium]
MDRISEADVVGDVAVEDARVPVKAPAKRRFPRVPDYLRDVYAWAYLNPKSVKRLDHGFVAGAILWGNYRRLSDAAIAEFDAAMRVLQPACAYGDVAPRLATKLGPDGALEMADIAPVQLRNVRKKLAPFPTSHLQHRDAADTPAASYDAVNCFFLIHEIPDAHRRRVVEALLDAVVPGGKVVFIDYHKPKAWHPLKPVMSLVFDTLEPFAKGLWHQEVWEMARNADRFTWSKTTYFGGLYQKVVAVTK